MATRTARIALVIAASLLMPIVPFLAVGELPGQRWLQGWDDHAIGFALVGAGLLAADVLLPVPSSLLGTLLGARLGLVVGFAATFVGLMIGNAIGFALGRIVFRRASTPIPAAPTAWALLSSRPVPVLAEAMVFAAGATDVPARTVLAATAAGNAVYAAVLAAAGTAWLPQNWVGPALAVPLLLPAVAWLIWRHRVRVQTK